MAFPTTSTVFGVNLTAALNNDLALDLGDATDNVFKYALFDNTMTTPVFSTDTGAYGSAPWTTSPEIDNSGSYSAGGLSLDNPTFVVNTAVSGARMLWKDNQTGYSITTFTGTPYGGLAYATISTAKYGIVAHYFGGPVAVSSGTLNLTWNSTYAAGTLFYIPFV